MSIIFGYVAVASESTKANTVLPAETLLQDKHVWVRSVEHAAQRVKALFATHQHILRHHAHLLRF